MGLLLFWFLSKWNSISIHQRVLERPLWQLRVLTDFGRLAKPETAICLFTKHLCCILCLLHLVSERFCFKTTSHESFEGSLAALFTSMEKETGENSLGILREMRLTMRWDNGSVGLGAGSCHRRPYPDSYGMS